MVLIWKDFVQSSYSEDQREAWSSGRGAVRTLHDFGGSRRIPALEMRMSRWDVWLLMKEETLVIPSFDVRSHGNPMALPPDAFPRSFRVFSTFVMGSLSRPQTNTLQPFVTRPWSCVRGCVHRLEEFIPSQS